MVVQSVRCPWSSSALGQSGRALAGLCVWGDRSLRREGDWCVPLWVCCRCLMQPRVCLLLHPVYPASLAGSLAGPWQRIMGLPVSLGMWGSDPQGRILGPVMGWGVESPRSSFISANMSCTC